MGDVGLGMTKEKDETWRECALRYARPWGMEHEVAETYDAEIRSGSDEAEAAWTACYEWDVLSLIENGVEKKPPLSKPNNRA